ncbi:MAG: PKD domain-containing protein, partial [Flavobacteriales bacterium]
GTGCNYSLSVFDSFGDGQGYISGSISLTTASGVTTFSNDWGSTQTTNFCLSCSGGSGGSSLPDANFNIQDNTVCPGTQVDFTSTSTNNPTSFSWTFEGGTPATSSASNPQNVVWSTPGTYDVTLTVANSSGSDTYVCSNCMTVYAPPTVSATGTNPACNGQSNGSINSTVSGTGPFTYLWSNGATTANVSNLAAGSYSVTVTSSTGCSATGSATLANPALLAVTLSSVNPSCSNTSNGSISTTVSGGTGNKTYLWSPTNSVSSSISNLLAGTYSVTVTDSRGCTASASSTLTAPSAITLNYSVTNVSCSGGSNGSINGSGSGGSGSLSYQWTPGNAITASISNLSGGSYSLLVTDGAGCTKTQSYSVTTPSAIVITGTVTNPNCPSGIGTIAVSASGGTGNKTF